MNTRGVLTIALIISGVAATCGGLGWWAGRTGAQQLAKTPDTAIAGTPVSIQTGQRVRLYWGARIEGEPAYTILASRVYHGSNLDQPFLALEDKKVYSGNGPSGPLLYEFADDRIVEARAGGQTGPTAFVQRQNTIHMGADADAPALFTFDRTQVYWGDPSENRILATSNTALNNPDLIKLVSLVLYMDILE